jgi:hypothetical protein
VRGRVIWEASDSLEVDLRASISQDEGTALQFADSAAVWAPFGPNPSVSLGCGVGIFPAASPQCLAGPVLFGENNRIENPNNPNAGIFQGDINNTNREIESSVNGVDERDLYSFSALLT